jgi:hypothetical protein
MLFQKAAKSLNLQFFGKRLVARSKTNESIILIIQ